MGASAIACARAQPDKYQVPARAGTWYQHCYGSVTFMTAPRPLTAGATLQLEK
jgi:hypothetical protein